ncbi:hypothetical protein P3T22_000621 [Paraburkholderia sp. GAS348]
MALDGPSLAFAACVRYPWACNPQVSPLKGYTQVKTNSGFPAT